MRATRARIYLNNIACNLNAVRKRIGKSPLICMAVKADAYGHGAVQVSRTALKNGASMLLVATVDEGAELREAGIDAPILLITQSIPEELETMAQYELVPFVSDQDYVRAFARAAQKTGKKHGVFLKIDTGMGRTGCRPEDAVELAQCIASCSNLRQMGTATHLAVSDSPGDDDREWTKRQVRAFKDAVGAMQGAGIDCGIVSSANSGAVIAHSSAHCDMVRPGIFLYGYQDAALLPDLQAMPAMELVTQIVLVKKIAKGESVSYGRAWTASEDTHIGILPVGYGDGLPRQLSTVPCKDPFFVVINGEQYPLVGRICMDQCMINLGHSPKAKAYDSAIVFGPNAPSLSAAGIADRIGTISYEICCNINKRVPRVYVESKLDPQLSASNSAEGCACPACVKAMGEPAK